MIAKIRIDIAHTLVDKPYDYKRSDAILKLKRSLLENNEEDGEIISDTVVVDIEYDDFPVIEDGKMHYEKDL